MTFYTYFKLLVQRALKEGLREFLPAKQLPVILMLLTLTSGCCWEPAECRIQLSVEVGVC